MKEYRNLKIEIAEKPLQLQGLAVVFNEVAHVGDFLEVIEPGAFEGVSFDDVVLLYNHDVDSLPLASTKNGSLSLWLSDTGLHFQATLPDTERGREVYEAIKTGLLRGCSFGFVVDKDSYIPEQNLRRIEKIKNVFEISLTPFPAYASSIVETRNKLFNKGDINMDNNSNDNLNPSFLPSDGMPDFGDTVYSSPEYRSAFYKTLLDKPLTATEKAAYKQAMSELETRSDLPITSSNAGAVIPTTTINEILTVNPARNGILAAARRFDMPANIAIPVAGATGRATFHAEGASIDSEAVDVSTVTFGAYELVKLFSISLKVRSMGIAAFESYINNELARSILDTIDYTMLYGTGENEPKGLFTDITWGDSNTVTATENVTYTDLVNALSLLAPAYSSGVKIALSQKMLYSQIYSLLDEIGRAIFIPDPQNASIGKILGLPVVIDDNLDNVILLGNFDYLGVNYSSPLLLEASKESGFRRGLYDYRAIVCVDTKCLQKSAFVKIQVAQG